MDKKITLKIDAKAFFHILTCVSLVAKKVPEQTIALTDIAVDINKQAQGQLTLEDTIAAYAELIGGQNENN
jgi:hypothetical protein